MLGIVTSHVPHTDQTLSHSGTTPGSALFLNASMIFRERKRATFAY